MKTSIGHDQKGMAMIEALPLLVIFVMFLSFGLGFWGAIHTAVLHSIGARAYAFETFRNRTNLNFFREDGSALTRAPLFLGGKGFRYHAIQNALDSRPNFVASPRNIAMGSAQPTQSTNVQTHNVDVYSIEDRGRNQKVETSPIWVMVGYGICLNAGCGR